MALNLATAAPLFVVVVSLVIAKNDFSLSIICFIDIINKAKSNGYFQRERRRRCARFGIAGVQGAQHQSHSHRIASFVATC